MVANRVGATVAEQERLLGRIAEGVARKNPRYRAFGIPTTVSVGDIQKRLRGDEALVVFASETGDFKGDGEGHRPSYIWVIRSSDATFRRLAIEEKEIADQVKALRCGLDYDVVWGDGRCADLLGVSYGKGDYNDGKPLPFDVARAYDLYRKLFGGVEELIRGKQLLIVASGPLTQLPFQLLVTEPARVAFPNSSLGYRDVAWLSRKHAITTLPAVSSLEALRAFAKDSHADEIYVGFGNPLLQGEPEKYKEDADRAALARARQRCDSLSGSKVSSADNARQGIRSFALNDAGLADLAAIRRQVPLPETAEELCDVAKIVGVSAAQVHLGAEATESAVKQLSADGSLSKYRIIHFATHGFVAGQLSATSEPGLVLTPPETASEGDDGYLAASEIAALKLDADWVILSACNTAAGGTGNADALSGLARAFFYAGARSLLVSHWAVNSRAAVALVTKTASALKDDPKIGRAEALRRAMLSMINAGDEREAHPAFWAPFVLVGEGAATVH